MSGIMQIIPRFYMNEYKLKLKVIFFITDSAKYKAMSLCFLFSFAIGLSFEKYALHLCSYQVMTFHLEKCLPRVLKLLKENAFKVSGQLSKSLQ